MGSFESFWEFLIVLREFEGFNIVIGVIEGVKSFKRVLRVSLRFWEF